MNSSEEMLYFDAMSRLPPPSKPEADAMDVDALNQVSPTSQPEAYLSWDSEVPPSWMLVSQSNVTLTQRPSTGLPQRLGQKNRATPTFQAPVRMGTLEKLCSQIALCMTITWKICWAS